MATGFTTLDALNGITKAGMKEDKPTAKFRTKDISIFKMYRNKGNFYGVNQIEELSEDIKHHGLKQNLEIRYSPCSEGEYEIIAGERRWEALKLLVSMGHKEFEYATSKITVLKNEWEESVELIAANTYREKTEWECMQEEIHLKAALQGAKEEGISVCGYDLKHGKIRTIIAKIMMKSETKVQQYDSIGTRLIPELLEDFRQGKIGFSAAYELSTFTVEEQRNIHENHENIKLKEVTEIKEEKKQEENEKSRSETGEFASRQQDINEMSDSDTENNVEADGEIMADEGKEVAAGLCEMNPPEKTDDYVDPQPEKVISLCYSCKNYSECNEKSDTVKNCNVYINKAESEKTEEQRYSEEQDRIDRETAVRLRERADIEKMQSIPSDNETDTKIHDVKLAAMYYDDVISGRKPFELRKNDRNYRVGEILREHECIDGEETGRIIVADIIYLLEDYTGLQEGYCILGINVAKYDI